MSNFFANITSTGVAAPDNTTLVLKHFGGKVTLTFQDSDHMNEVAAAILAATRPPTPTPVLPRGEIDVESLKIETGDETGADNNKTGVTATKKEQSVEDLSSQSSSSETNSEPPTPLNNTDPDSSFESYDGYGLTQEINF